MRVSYSILSNWARGNYEDAVNTYLGHYPAATPAMEAGKYWHKKWERDGRQTGCLPEIFGGRKLDSPKFELDTKKVIMLADWIQLVGVFDVLEPGIGTDYKSGSSPSSAYANGFQHKVLQILEPSLKRFDYHGFNQYTNEVTMSVCHLTQKTLEEGIEYVITHASDMRSYLEQNNLVKEVKA